MSAVVKAVKKVVSSVFHVIKDFVVDVWDNVVMPILEEVFSWFGIEDETVVTVQKVSSKLFDDSDKDPVKAAKSRAILQWMKSDISLWKFLYYEMGLTRGRVNGYYKYAEKGHYVHGLPKFTVQGENSDNTATKAAIDLDKSIDSAVTYNSNSFPTPEEYFKHDLQSSPTNYKPGLDQLTYDNEWGTTFNDWKWGSVTYIEGSNTYDILIYRQAQRATFWIEGPTEVTEGGSVDLIVRSNRPVPAGKSVDINLTYSGTVDPVEYTAPATVVMNSEEDFTIVTVTISENSVIDTLRNLVVTLDSITNTGGAFENWTLSNNTVDISVHDNDTLLLSLDSVFINESETSVTLPVTLSMDTAEGFTVDYVLSDGTAIEGIDYDGTGGTLTFVGTAGEVQSIEVPLTADVSAESREYFTVSLLNCSDASVDVSRTAEVTIMDTLPEGPEPDFSNYSLTFSRPQFSDERAMVCKYHEVDGDPDDWYYWIYYYSTNLYTDVDPANTVITELQMLPVGIVRRDKVNVDIDKEGDEYRTTRKLLQLVQLDIGELIDGINSNPDKDMIDDAYVNFAVSPSDEGAEVSKLLYLTFYEIIHVRGLSSNSNKYTALFEEQDVNNGNVWSSHSYTTGLSGVVCPEGEHTHSIITVEDTDDSRLVLQFQKTASTYDEIHVDNMNSMSSIKYDGYHKAAFNNVRDASFTLPLSWYVYEQLTNEELMRVYKKIFRVDFYSIEVTHLSWYETPAFFKFIKFALVIVAVVTTILTFGAASGFWAGVWAAVQQLAISYIVMEVAVFIAEATGNAYVAAAVALVTALVLRDVSGLEQAGFMTAQGVTEAVSAYSASLGTVYKKEYEDMVSETEKLVDEMEEKEEYYKENSPAGDQILDASFYASLTSSDSLTYQARDAQYDYDSLLTGAYDRLVKNYHSLLLDLNIN